MSPAAMTACDAHRSLAHTPLPSPHTQGGAAAACPHLVQKVLCCDRQVVQHKVNPVLVINQLLHPLWGSATDSTHGATAGASQHPCLSPLLSGTLWWSAATPPDVQALPSAAGQLHAAGCCHTRGPHLHVVLCQGAVEALRLAGILAQLLLLQTRHTPQPHTRTQLASAHHCRHTQPACPWLPAAGAQLQVSTRTMTVKLY